MKNIKCPLLYRRNKIPYSIIYSYGIIYSSLNIHQKINFKFFQFNYFNLPYPNNLDITNYVPTQNILS